MKDLIDRILHETNHHENPFFVALRDKTFERTDFVETQIQFFFAVAFFSRPMAIVAAKIPKASQRMEIIRNVWEEHGEGDHVEMHDDTFQILLERLDGIGRDEIAKRALWPEVRQFNSALVGAAVMDDYRVSVSMLGMIERMFSDISAWIGQGIIDNEWMAQGEMVHYNLHQDLDIRHSDDFFNVLSPLWERGAVDQYYIEQGLRLGALSFDALYRGLYTARARRAYRDVFVPHIRD